MVRRYGLVLVLALLGSGCGWLNIGGNKAAVAPAKLEPIQDPIAIQTLWETRVGSGTGGTFIKLRPALSRGQVYAASHDGVVMAVDASSGERLWRVDTRLPISAGVGLGDGLVLVGTGKGEVLALDMDDGEEAWRTPVFSEILATPRAGGGIAVVRTVDGRFIGLDTLSGARLWTYEYTMPALTLRGSSPPLLAQDLVIAGLDTGRLLVLTLQNGAPVWERTIAPARGRTDLERMVDITAEPRLVGSLLYVAAYQGNVTAIDLRDGSTVWRRDLSSHAGLDADARQAYVVDDKDNVWALDARNGDVRWQQTGLTGRALSAPVLSEDYVVVGDFEGYLHWLARDDGRLMGRVRTGKKGITAPPVASVDTLYVLSDDGRLSAFRVTE